MKRPGNALHEHTLMEDAAATIKINGYNAQQARGIVNQYGIDDSWIKDSMNSKQIAEALFTRADIARYCARTK